MVVVEVRFYGSSCERHVSFFRMGSQVALVGFLAIFSAYLIVIIHADIYDMFDVHTRTLGAARESLRAKAFFCWRRPDEMACCVYSS